MKALISITSFMKSDSLRALLETMLKFKYDDHRVHIADDNNGERYLLVQETNPNHPIWKTGATSPHEMESVLDVYNSLKKEFRNGLSLSYGPRMGIWGNKNRGIQFFLERYKEGTHLCLMDDDIRMIKEGFMEELADVLEKNTSTEAPRFSLSHINTTWSDPSGTAESAFEGGSNWNVARDGWHRTFPVEALGDRVEFRKGAMGCLSLFTRKTVEQIGYMSSLGGSLYGYEHSLYSGKSLLRSDGRSPCLLPSYDFSEAYFWGGAIPNNYGNTVEEAAKGDPYYQKAMNDYNFGLGLKCKTSGLDHKKETILG